MHQEAFKLMQERATTLESELSKSKESQRVLERRLSEVTNEFKDQQFAISRLDIDVQGTKAMTIKHDIQLSRKS